MFCTCKNPKPKPMTVYHKSFFVCAKSEGGCGLEMAEGKARVLYADRTTISVGGKVIGHLNNSTIDPRSIKKTGQFNGNINPHINPVNCPKCAGQCTQIRRNAQGRLEEVDCDYCNGKGRV